MTIQEILKSIGYSDADIQAIDPKLLQVIGETYGAVETERDSFKSLNDQWQEKLDKEYNPAITQAEKAAFDARNEAAALKSRVEFAEQFGYLPKTEGAGDPTKPTAPVTDPNVFDPTKHNLVTKKDLESAYGTFADAEGRAMTLLHDLSDEYRDLYGGKTLYEYVGAAGKRGMTALRNEAVAARKPLDQYVQEKFNFAGKRTELETKRQQELEANIRKDERAKVASEYGNPQLRIPVASVQPFIPVKATEGKQPWERGTDAQLQAQRLQKARESFAKDQIQ